jgi:hypothetical protein
VRERRGAGDVQAQHAPQLHGGALHGRYNSVGFDENDYAGILQDTMKMDAFTGSTPRAWTTAPPEAATVPVTVIGVRP